MSRHNDLLVYVDRSESSVLPVKLIEDFVGHVVRIHAMFQVRVVGFAQERRTVGGVEEIVHGQTIVTIAVELLEDRVNINGREMRTDALKFVFVDKAAAIWIDALK